MDHLPIFLDVKDRKVLVAGGGTAAARKAEMALRAGARIELYSDALGDEFIDLKDHQRFTHHRRAVSAEDLEGCVLAYGAAEDETIDRHVHALAKAARVPVNVPDQISLCDFIAPAVLDRSPIVVGISSGGASPILARAIKARLETLIPASFGKLAGFVGGFRDVVAKRLPKSHDRLRFWERATEGTAADFLLAGNEAAAKAQLLKELNDASETAAGPPLGEVYLVGAGPGDPDLLTFRALRLMQRADVVLYDRLIGDEVMNLVRRDAQRIYVGKLPQQHTMPQEEISQMLARLAREGKRVLRLKGGDPFIFGRGGEEIEVLASEGIPFQVVPGITAASGCSSYGGIPLTHRDHAQACIFVTGHGKDGHVNLDWKTLLQPRQTVAIYMGLSSLPALMQEFISRGADPKLPAAVIENGTRPEQRVVTGTLDTLAQKIADAGFKAPAMIVIGTVVTLRDQLSWFNPEQQGAAASPTD